MSTKRGAEIPINTTFNAQPAPWNTMSPTAELGLKVMQRSSSRNCCENSPDNMPHG